MSAAGASGNGVSALETGFGVTGFSFLSKIIRMAMRTSIPENIFFKTSPDMSIAIFEKIKTAIELEIPMIRAAEGMTF